MILDVQSEYTIFGIQFLFPILLMARMNDWVVRSIRDSRSNTRDLRKQNTQHKPSGRYIQRPCCSAQFLVEFLRKLLWYLKTPQRLIAKGQAKSKQTISNFHALIRVIDELAIC